MNEPKEEAVPKFMYRLKPRDAPSDLRELVAATVLKELKHSEQLARWFTPIERRRFRIAGALLLASIAFCILVELGERTRMARLDFKNENQNREQDLFPFLACHDPSKLQKWFLSYQGMTDSSTRDVSKIQITVRQIIANDPEFVKTLRGYHGLF